MRLVVTQIVTLLAGRTSSFNGWSPSLILSNTLRSPSDRYSGGSTGSTASAEYNLCCIEGSLAGACMCRIGLRTKSTGPWGAQSWPILVALRRVAMVKAILQFCYLRFRDMVLYYHHMLSTTQSHEKQSSRSRDDMIRAPAKLHGQRFPSSICRRASTLFFDFCLCARVQSSNLALPF